MPSVRVVYFSLICLIGVVLAACTDSAPSTTASPQQEADAQGDITNTEGVSAHSPIELMLVEGTNLAVAVNPVSGDKVLALQGTLYFQAAGGAETYPLTQWMDDAWEPSFSPDGSWLVYKSYRDGSFDLWQLAMDASGETAEPQKLTDSPFDDREPQVSPDGASVLFSSDRLGAYDIWELNLDSGELDVLTTTDAESHSPTWSPEGSAFAYVVSSRAGSRLYRQQRGGEPQALYAAESQISGLQWLPDDSGLSFRALDRDEVGNAYTTLKRFDFASGTVSDVSPAGSDVFPFPAHWEADGSLIYTADGKVKHQFADGRIETEEFVVTIALDRTPYPKKDYQFDRVDPKPVLGVSYPVISPDGTQIAFGALGDLWLWTPDTQQLEQLTDDPAADQMPNWSADGSKLVYVSDADGHPRIHIRSMASGDTQVLMLDHEEISFPSWSPSGDQLAFFTDVPANPLAHVTGQLSVYDLTTQQTQRVMAPMPPQTVSWGADGQHLLTTQLVPFSSRYREGLYLPVVVDLESGDSHHLVPVPHRSVTHASLAADGRLVYSQDGVLNQVVLGADYQIAQGPEVLHADLADSPSLSQDGAFVVFQSGASLHRMNTHTGAVDDVTPPLTWQREQPQGEWILRAGRVFDGVSDTYRENLDIYIHNNRISAIEPIDPNTSLPVLDARDRVVIPGLFESHAHIGDHNHSEPQGRAWLAYGITSVRDPGSNPYLANERREAWDSGRRVGPRTFITGHNMDGNRVFYAVVEGITSDAHLARALRRSQELEVDFIKTYVRMSDARQRQVVEFAHDMGIPVTSHEILPAAAFGVDHIEHFTGTSRRGYTTKISELGRTYQDVITVLASSGMGIVPTMVVPGVVLTFEEQNDLYDTPQFNAFYGPESKQNYQNFMGFFGPGSEGYVDAYGELLSALIERGALVGTGTDSPFTHFATGLHGELRLYQREGLDQADILRAATLQSARIAGADADLGSIEVGKLADLVVVDGDPLADIAELSEITHTIKNGRVYTLDELLNP